MMRPLPRRKQASTKHYPWWVPERPKEQTVNLPSSTEGSNPSPPPLFTTVIWFPDKRKRCLRGRVEPSTKVRLERRERTLPQRPEGRGAIATSYPSPPFILLNSLQCDFTGGFPSGQREQTVNLPSSTSKVRILPHHHLLKTPQSSTLRYSIFCPTGKDEKLRPRFDSSEARELPQATARRAKRE